MLNLGKQNNELIPCSWWAAKPAGATCCRRAKGQMDPTPERWGSHPPPFSHPQNAIARNAEGEQSSLHENWGHVGFLSIPRVWKASSQLQPAFPHPALFCPEAWRQHFTEERYPAWGSGRNGFQWTCVSCLFTWKQAGVFASWSLPFLLCKMWK